MDRIYTQCIMVTRIWRKRLLKGLPLQKQWHPGKAISQPLMILQGDNQPHSSLLLLSLLDFPHWQNPVESQNAWKLMDAVLRGRPPRARSRVKSRGCIWRSKGKMLQETKWLSSHIAHKWQMQYSNSDILAPNLIIFPLNYVTTWCQML